MTLDTTPVLAGDCWRARADAHAAAADALTADHRKRAGTGARHPVEDFLFTYYSLRPSQLRRWTPGVGIGLLDAAEHAERRFFRTVDGITSVDVEAFRGARGDQIRFIHDLLTAVGDRTPQFGCFGLHEWAMVYRRDPGEIRHSGRILRLGARATDQVVEQHRIGCSHYDAHRFFTPSASSRNLLQPTVSRRIELEQPGCLHVGMDLYKWAYKLLPAVSGELLLDCFRLARAIREVDMRASPYDLADLDRSPIRIETAEGKAEYVAQQRAFTARAVPLRDRLSTITAAVLAD